MIAVFICFYNGLLVTGWEDFAGAHHDALAPFFPIFKLPGDFFSLTTPSLALLLSTLCMCLLFYRLILTVLMLTLLSCLLAVFKTNTSYKRWDEGRKNWGAIVNSCRTIVREAAAWVHEVEGLSNEQKQKLMVRLEQAVWAFPRSLTRHLLSAQEDDADYARDCREKLRPDLAEDLIAARHKPTRALYELSAAINEFPLGDRRIVSIDKATTVLCDSLGSNERLATSPGKDMFD